MCSSFLDKWLCQEDFETVQRLTVKAYEESVEPVYPPRSTLLAALSDKGPESVQVCILGQDPYHKKGQAHGLSFSVPKGVSLPPSLKNIYKELYSDLGVQRKDGDLTGWSNQGVLLLNSVLTVVEAKAGSHQHLGWQKVTEKIVHKVAQGINPTVFIAWGAWAQKSIETVLEQIPGAEQRHLVIKSVHPSPLSAHRGFFGSKPFSRTNAFLISHKRPGIDWAL